MMEWGISSRAMAAHLSGMAGDSIWRGSDWPHDPSDFRRCQLFLRNSPHLRESLPRMAARGPQWARLAAAWDEIHQTLEAEIPGYLDNPRGNAPRTYRLMRRVIEGAPICTDCDGTGQAEACPKCKGSGRRSGGRCRNDGCWHGYFNCPACRGNGYTAVAS